jgi:hypothetical protein
VSTFLGDVAPLPGGGVEEYGDQPAALGIDKTLAGRLPALSRVIISQRPVAPTLDQYAASQNHAQDGRWEHRSRPATGDRGDCRRNQQDTAKDEEPGSQQLRRRQRVDGSMIAAVP